MYNDNQVHYFKSNKTQHALGFMLSFITLKVMQMNLASIKHLITDKTIKKHQLLCDDQIDNINYLNLLT